MAGGIIGSLMYAVGFKFNSGGLDEADSKVKTLTKGVIGLGAAGGSAMIGLGAAALDAASKFESAMSNVQLTTGQTTDQMAETREISKNLYNQNFGEDWADLGNSISAVAKATGLTGDSLESASREAMLYSNKFDGDVTESIAGVSVAMKNFGVTSTEAFNLLTQGQNNGTNTQGDMLDSINEYSQAFSSMGFTMEDTMGYLTNGLKAGARNTDLLGDAMNEFSILSIEAGGTAEESFKALGLDANKMMQTFSSGGPAARQSFRDIVSMISDIEDPVQQNTIGIGLFGTMFEELGVKAFSALDDVNTGFDKSKGSAANLFNSFTSIGDSMQYFKRHVETGILIPIGQKLLPYLNQFGSWISGHQGEIAAFGEVIGNGLGAAIEKVSGWVQAAIPYLQDFGSQAATVFGSLVTKGRELWTSMEPVVTLLGTTLLNAAVSLWPVLQNIASALSEGASEVMSWEGFTPVVVGLTSAIVILKTAVLADTAAKKINAIWTARSTIATRIMGNSSLVAGFKMIKGWAMSTGSAISSAAVYIAKSAVIVGRWAWMGIQSMIHAARMAAAWVVAMGPIGWIITAVVGLAVLIIANWSKIKAVTVSVFTAVWNWMKNVWNGIMTVVTNVASAIWGAITSAWNSISSTTTAVFTSVWNWLGSVWNSILGTISGAVSAVWNAITGAWNNVVSTTSTLMTQVWNKITNIWNGIVNGIKTAGTNVWNAVTNMWSNVTGFFDGINLWDTGKKIITGFMDGIMSMAESLKEKVKGIVDGIKGFFGFKTTANVSVSTTDATSGVGVDGSHANGLANVPFDGYIGELHKGERVLTAEENKDYNRGYTPDSAPARSVGSSKVNFTAPAINITIQGNADEKTIANIRETVRQEMQDVIDAVSRIMGVEIVGAN
ncbi:hypothetical protein GCM10010912_22880 [Paenibacillus albidus]|uniref:Phage tail tape measure protein domain-containing protein n=1 Tax=Paenibacillus albidus TaxID=2041023 RepID=A0A917C8R5_9BACL|nr:phage tail tape measure protein [Paenibacillus albidus]GGF77218.1 hypothetical protein GCM10010912_22880 [Paenibacillus albidus]